MEELISISEMAKLHGITRQTLIWYDNMDIFKPVKVAANGYRYYSKFQIPYLREICFLRAMDIGLKEIQEHFQERTPAKEKELLEKQRQYILTKLANLNKIRNYLNGKIEMYQEAVDAQVMGLNVPFERSFGPRKAIFYEYIKPINKVNLHLTLMHIWLEFNKYQLVPSGGFGSVLPLKTYETLEGAGSYIILPYNHDLPLKSIEFPEGPYVCMYKYGMPYDNKDAKYLMHWLTCNGYEACGDIVDVCLLDTTFYKKDLKKEDFCMLQIPVRKK